MACRCKSGYAKHHHYGQAAQCTGIPAYVCRPHFHETAAYERAVEAFGKYRTFLHRLLKEQGLIRQYFGTCIEHLPVGLEFLDVAQLLAGNPYERIEPQHPAQHFHDNSFACMSKIDVCALMQQYHALAFTGHPFVRHIDLSSERERSVYVRTADNATADRNTPTGHATAAACENQQLDAHNQQQKQGYCRYRPEK